MSVWVAWPSPSPHPHPSLLSSQDDLIERLGGPNAVAEMTGRKKRFVKSGDGAYK